MAPKKVAEKEIDKDNVHTNIIDLDVIEYEPIVLRLGGVEYRIDQFTTGDQKEIGAIERKVNETGFEPIFEFWRKKFNVPLEVWDRINMPVYQDFRERIMSAILFGKKKELKKLP